MSATPDEYAWLSASLLQTAGCITVVPTAAAERVASAFGCDPMDPTAAKFEIGSEAVAGTDAVWVAASDAAVVMFEDNGWQGTRSEVLRAASKASSTGIAASIFWNVEGMVVFTAARKGKIVCSEELLDSDPADLPRQLRRLAALTVDEDCDLVAIGAAMVSQFTGAGFTEETLGQAVFRTLLPVADDLTAPGPEGAVLRFEAPDLVEAIVAAGPARQRRLAGWAATAAAAQTGLSHEPPVQELLGQLSDSTPPTIPPGLGPLLARWQREQQQWEKHYPSWDGDSPGSHALQGDFIRARVHAGRALKLTAHPNPLEAALQVLYAALVTFTYSRTQRGGFFVEDDRGRRLEYPPFGTLGDRPQRLVDLALEALAEPEPDWDALRDRLPRPVIGADRDAIIRRDQERQARGDFNTWQLVALETSDIRRTVGP